MCSRAANRRVVLELEPAQDRIRGRVSDADYSDGGARSFDGWLELSTLLDAMRPRPDSAHQPSTEDVAP